MRPEKESMVRELKEKIDGSGYVLIADYQGLSVEQLGALRKQLSENRTGLYVVKNTMLKRSSRDSGIDGLDEYLSGPSAIIAGDGEVTRVAKTIRAFAKDNERPSIKGGLVARRVCAASEIEALADIPPREVLLGQVVGTIAAPMSGLVGVFSQKLMSLLYVLKAVEEKKSGAGQG